jgi:hypothetical protein
LRVVDALDMLAIRMVDGVTAKMLAFGLADKVKQP